MILKFFVILNTIKNWNVEKEKKMFFSLDNDDEDFQEIIFLILKFLKFCFSFG